MKRIMLDLETLGTSTEAHVLSIGWAIFDGIQVLSSGHVNVRHDEQESRERSFGTASWWVQQGMKNPDAAKAWLYPGIAYAPEHALKVLTWAIHQAGHSAEVWANSPSFDCAILRSMYKQYLGEETPWPFYMERDFRTVKKGLYCDSASPNGVNTMSVAAAQPTAHTAEGDAVAQAQFLLDIEAKEEQQRQNVAAAIFVLDQHQKQAEEAHAAQAAKETAKAAKKANRVVIDKRRKPGPTKRKR
jgi:hypothetical protein